MSDKVKQFPGRGSLNDQNFQYALRAWRAWAHRRGFVVASPVRLIGAERTFLGDSDDVSFGPKDYKLTRRETMGIGPGGDAGWTIPGLPLSKKDHELLSAIGDELEARSEFDIKDVRAPSSAEVDAAENERGRWEIMATASQRLGTVVRIGDGSKKRYIMSLWDGGFYRVEGQPTYDIPLFGLPDVRANDHMPIMVHEGPKAWWGAKSRAGNPDLGGLAGWLSRFVHVGWHGSDIGMEWTDWSPLRGRRVLIWSDMDDTGTLNSRRLAKKLALMGNVVEYVDWSAGDIFEGDGWDWGDEVIPLIHSMTRTDIKERTRAVESPVDGMGNLLEPWVKRSFYDRERSEIYEQSTEFRPIPLANYSIGLGKSFREKLVDSGISRYIGMDFRPGVAYGKLKNGKINLCKPCIREPIRSSPLDKDIYLGIVDGWLRHMIPNVRERKHVIRKAAWALTRPQKLSQHMIVLQGDSGIGKSVLLDLIVRLAGVDRASACFPDTVMGKFNGSLMGKAIICIHEIHSNEMTRKQNASRLKEVIANETITFEEKNRPRVSMKNVIHWFAATNERTPFALEHGNDRFYFVRCRSPRTKKEIGRKDRFFRKWLPLFEDQGFLDRLYAAAKYYCENMPVHRIEEVTGRAKRQSIWKDLEDETLTPWQQYIVSRLEELYLEPVPDGGHPVVFFAKDLVSATCAQFKGAGEIRVRRFLNEIGFYAIKRKDGSTVQLRRGSGRRDVAWCRGSDLRGFRAIQSLDGIQPRLLTDLS